MTRYSWEQLEQLDKKSVIAEYNRVADHVDLPLSFLREELFRRDMQEQNGRIEAMTRHIRGLTIIIAILTLVSTVAVVWSTRCG